MYLIITVQNMEILLKVIFFMVWKISSMTPFIQRFDHLNGLRMSQGTKISANIVFGRQYCAMMCSYSDPCFSANFEPTTGTCELNTRLPREGLDYMFENDTWEVLYPSLGDAWRLVFRATAGIGISVYDAWIGSVSLPVAMDSCKSTEFTSCLTHYRSSVLDHWTTNKIKQVRFSLHKNNVMVVNIIFKNLASDNNTSWFHQDRLINSSFPDMTSTSQYNHFSSAGHDLRRFYISELWNGCDGDIGWIAVYDGTGVCPNEKGVQFPYFGYASANQKGNQIDFQSADILFVFINKY